MLDFGKVEMDLKFITNSSDLLRSLSAESSHRNLLLSVQKAETIQRNTIVETIVKLKNQIVSITKEDIILVKELCTSLSSFLFFCKKFFRYLLYLFRQMLYYYRIIYKLLFWEVV